MRFLRLVVPEVEGTQSRLSDTTDRLACQDDWDLCGRGYLDSTTFLEAPADAGKTGTNLLLLPPRRRHRLGTEHSSTFALKMQQVRHAPTSRPKPKPRAPRTEAERCTFSPLPFYPPRSITHVHSFIMQILSQVYYVSDPVLDTEIYTENKKQRSLPHCGAR